VRFQDDGALSGVPLEFFCYVYDFFSFFRLFILILLFDVLLMMLLSHWQSLNDKPESKLVRFQEARVPVEFLCYFYDFFSFCRLFILILLFDVAVDDAVNHYM
jgi:hypothetical protein